MAYRHKEDELSTIRTWYPKPKPAFLAVRYSGDNLAEVMSITPKSVKRVHSDGQILIQIAGGLWVTIRPGNIILSHPDGRVSLCEESEFLRSYQLDDPSLQTADEAEQ